MREYNITTLEEFQKILTAYIEHFLSAKICKLEFKPITVIFKRYKKKKTGPQHRYYWICINELKKALREAGSIYNQDQVHEMIKREAGFTEMQELPNGKMIMVTKSIANDSKDATLNDMRALIDFIIRFAQENLNYRIENPMK